MAAVPIADNRGSKENLENLRKPEKVLLFSGKRKSGKDFITDILYERITEKKSVIIKISAPIKSHWAKSLNLDIDKLLGDGKYKEKYRLEMVKWGEDMRRKDYGCFCRAAVDMYKAYDKPIWIISDIRRKTDIQWFKENFGAVCKTIHIICDEETRKKRGWVFTPGIDDSETECDLDDVSEWDLIIDNNSEDFEEALTKILNLINQ